MTIVETAANIITRRRLLMLCIVLATSGLAVAGYLRPRMPLTSDRESSSQSGGRLQVATDAFQRRATDGYLVIEVEQGVTRASVAALRKVAAAIESLPQVESLLWMDSIPVLNVFGLRQSVLAPDDASDEAFEETRQRAMVHPLIRGQLVSQDGRTLLMPISLDWTYGPSDEECAEQILDLARETAAAEGLEARIRMTGRVPLYIAHKESFDRSQTKFQIISYVLVLVLSSILFRGVSAVLIVAAAPAMGIFWAMGLLNLLGDNSNPLTNIVLPVLLLMVGLADGVHLMVHIRRDRAEGADAGEAARSAIRHVGVACGLTSLTTAIGFASLSMAESHFVQEFGRACALGVLIMFCAVLIVIPLLCTTRLAKNVHHGHEHDIVGRAMGRMSGAIDGVLRRSRLMTVIAVLATIGFASIAAYGLRPDDRMQDSQPTGSEAYQALAHCDQVLGGIETIEVLIRWDDDSRRDQVLEAVRGAERVLAEEPLLGYSLSILGILEALPGSGPDADRLSMIELLPSSTLQRWLDLPGRQARITARIQDLGIASYEPVFRRVESQLAEVAAELPGFELELGGGPITRGRRLYRVVIDLAASLGTATVIIFFVLAWAYRSPRIGLISVVPNLFPLVVTAALLVLLRHPLEIASVCSFTVCLGIAVDDTIHFLSRYRVELQQCGDVSEAIRRSFVGVGTAMVITTMILVIGFSTVLTSEMPSHRYFAAMAVSTIAAALVGDLVFLPAMLKCFAPAGKS